MNENQKHLYEMMDNYFYDCKQNGVSDFRIWCEDNIENEEQETYMEMIADHVDAIAYSLYLNITK